MPASERHEIWACSTPSVNAQCADIGGPHGGDSGPDDLPPPRPLSSSLRETSAATEHPKGWWQVWRPWEFHGELQRW